MGAFCSDCLKAISGPQISQYETIHTEEENRHAHQQQQRQEQYQQQDSKISQPKEDRTVRRNRLHLMTLTSYFLSQEIATSGIAISNSIPSAGFFLNYDLKDVIGGKIVLSVIDTPLSLPPPRIGVGSTANCHRCCRKSDSREFACKVIDKRQIEAKFTGLLEQFYVEIKVQNCLRCFFFSYPPLSPTGLV
jgi:hypothetical protein